MRCIVSPYSRPLRSGNQNAKNYPYWDELIRMLNCVSIETIQIGVSGEQQLPCKRSMCDANVNDLTELLTVCEMWISVDNFFQHFANYHKRPGVVLWGKSDPNIFGYSKNLNLIKDRSLLRPHQFATWDDEICDPECFLHPHEVFEEMRKVYDFIGVLAFDL